MTARLASNNAAVASTNLIELAAEAARTNRYIRVYEEHLLRGLGNDEEADRTRLYQHEEQENMQWERITLLRQISMQRIAKRLRAQASQVFGSSSSMSKTHYDALR